ncbi:MAG: trypsin-like serine protease [Chloroflexota bacterium]
MKRAAVAFAAAIAMMVMAVAPAAAITKNYEPDSEHTFVGLIGFYDQAWTWQHRCTGELIAPTVVLTAGHCTDDGSGGHLAQARIWFEQNAGAQFDGVQDPVTGYPNTCLEPAFCREADVMFNYGFNNFAGFPNTHDVGIVILREPITTLGYGHLAHAGALDSLNSAKGVQDKDFRVSGYGISFSAKRGAVAVSYRVRLQAVEQLVNTVNQNTDGYNIQLNGNGDDRGGTCSGDSGGPVFYAQDSWRIVAVTSFGHTNAGCRGDGFYYRLDRAEVIAWILSVSGSDAAFIRANIE